ncbi:MAG: Bug family tripartite tricarboxylate transporter substrate binding protein [Lautropia sp.]
MKRSAFLRSATRLGLTALVTSTFDAAATQRFPSGPVTLICPYGPGTGIDIVARIISQKLSESWAQPVVVKNQPGASGAIGAAAAAAAVPDGTTLLIMANSHLINQHVAKNVVDAMQAFTPVAPAGKVPYLLTVSNSLPVRTVGELVALARSQPGALHYSGIHGSVPHLLGVTLASAGKIDLRFVAYKSTTDAMTDAVSGRVPIWFTTVATAAPLIQAGKIRALAVTSSRRSELLPDVPTTAQAGYPALNLGAAFYFMAPAQTPRPIVEQLNRDIASVLTTSEVLRKLAEQGAEADSSSPAELARLLREENVRWAEIVRISGIAAQ